MAQIPGPLDNQHPLTGNVPVSQAGDVNTILRALAEQRQRRLYDLLGRRTQDTTDE